MRNPGQNLDHRQEIGSESNKRRALTLLPFPVQDAVQRRCRSMTYGSASSRSARRTEPESHESDVAAIFERRLRSRGIRTDDFLDWRGATDLPPIPTIVPVRFGRGTTESGLLPLDTAQPDAEPTTAP